MHSTTPSTYTDPRGNVEKIWAYLILVTNTIYLSGMWMFVFYIVFSSVEHRFSGIISAVAFLSGSICRLVFSQQIAKFLNRFRESDKIKTSILIRLFGSMLFLIFFSTGWITFEPLLLLLIAYILSILMLVDGYARFNIKYLYDEKKLISLNRNNSISVIGNRGSIALAASLAFAVKDFSIYSLILGSVFIIGTLSSLLYFFLFAEKKKYNREEESRNGSTNVSIQKIKKLCKFCALYLFIMNFFFSSGTLLVSHIIINNKMASFFGINVLTVFYIGFILYAIFAILFDKKITSFYTPLNILIFTILLSSFNATMTLFVPSVLEVSVIIFFSGIFYGFTLAGFSVITLQYIKSDRASIFYSKIDTYGRSGFLLSYIITGLAIDAEIDEVFILQVLNLFGILGAATIFILFRKYTEEMELTSEKC